MTKIEDFFILNSYSDRYPEFYKSCCVAENVCEDYVSLTLDQNDDYKLRMECIVFNHETENMIENKQQITNRDQHYASNHRHDGCRQYLAIHCGTQLETENRNSIKIKSKNLKRIKVLLILTALIVIVTSCQNNEKSDSNPYSITYYSNESGKREIYLTNIEGTSNVKITNPPKSGGGYLAWSPDGEHIAFYAKYDDEKTWSIHTVNSDGTNWKRLTHADGKWDSSPAWSPDGNKIVFARDYKDSTGLENYEIWIMNSDGSEQNQIKSLSGGGPCFTPDGRIVFYSEYKDKKSEICIADIDGSNLIQLTDNDVEDWHPEVSPDGKEIAFVSKRGNQEIHSMNIDGSNQKQLTSSDIHVSHPSWSPDGSQLIFQSRTDENWSIYIMNKDGSSVRKIINNGRSAVWLKKIYCN